MPDINCSADQRIDGDLGKRAKHVTEKVRFAALADVATRLSFPDSVDPGLVFNKSGQRQPGAKRRNVARHGQCRLGSWHGRVAGPKRRARSLQARLGVVGASELATLQRRRNYDGAGALISDALSGSGDFLKCP